MINLYPDQLQAKREIYHYWNNGVIRQVFGSPTGSGKTITTMDIIKDAISRNKKPMFLVDRISLAHQAFNKFSENGINVSLYQGQNTSIHWDENCIVASIHTLKNRRIPECDLIIIDECHINHKHYREILDTYDNVKTLGLSATPLSDWLPVYFEKIVKAPTMGELIELGRLVPFIIFNISEPDLEKVKVTAGDYNEKQLAKTMNQSIHIAEVVDSWLKLGEGRKTIAFAVDINHAKSMAADFQKAGIRAAHMDCYMNDKEIHALLEDYEEGDLDILISVGKLTTGFDSPRTECIILDRPTKSLALHIQQCGRGPRMSPGKTDVIILDHTLNCLNHGHPANFEIPDFENGEIKEVKAKKKTYKCQNKSCEYIAEKRFEVCPVCGQEKIIAAEDYIKDPEIERIKAELTDFTEGTKANNTYSKEQKAEFYAGLKGHAKKKCYNQGWAAHKYKEKFGVWPNKYKDVLPKEPSEEVKNYIKYLNIKRAKSKKTA